VWTCGGGGQCGTCVINVREGGELLSDRTKTENSRLGGKPPGFRLACQTVIREGAGGRCVVQTKP
jgi:ferredoxin